jgi:hypothetical protein
MKVTLEFDCPEQENEMKLAVYGARYWNCLWELDQYCRNKLKFDDIETGEDELEDVREFIRQRIDLEEIE